MVGRTQTTMDYYNNIKKIIYENTKQRTRDLILQPLDTYFPPVLADIIQGYAGVPSKLYMKIYKEEFDKQR